MVAIHNPWRTKTMAHQAKCPSWSLEPRAEKSPEQILPAAASRLSVSALDRLPIQTQIHPCITLLGHRVRGIMELVLRKQQVPP